jgi:SWI/SNF-related matrix-associated actin-dependent regulator 1 of chromatin subfamily A
MKKYLVVDGSDERYFGGNDGLNVDGYPLPWVGVRLAGLIENHAIYTRLRAAGVQDPRCLDAKIEFGVDCWLCDTPATARDTVALLARHRSVEVVTARLLRRRMAAATARARKLEKDVRVARVPGELIVVTTEQLDGLQRYVAAACNASSPLRHHAETLADRHDVPGGSWCRDPYHAKRQSPFIENPSHITCHLRREGLLVRVRVEDALGGVVAAAFQAAGVLKCDAPIPLPEISAWVKEAGRMGVAVDADFDQADPWAALAAEARQVVRARRKKVPGWGAPTKAGLKLRAFQRAGVTFVLSHSGRAMIADEMGTGKTAQAIATAQMLDAKRVLVVAPAAVRYVWREEIPRWAAGTVQVLERKTDTPRPDARWVVTSYGLISDRTAKGKDGKPTAAASKQRSALLHWKPDLMVLDEAHHCKSASSRRTLAVIELSKSVSRVLGLTGTPIQNRTDEAATLASVIDPVSYAVLRDAKVSITRCRHLLRELAIRRTKEDVLKELPPVSERTIRLPGPVELPGPEVLCLWNPPVGLPRWAKAIDDPGVRAFAGYVPSNLNQVESLRAMIGAGKAASRTVVNYIHEIAEQQPVVVFAHHHGAADALVKALAAKSLRVAVADGRTTAKVRMGVVTAFQRGKFDVLIAGMEALGEGVTLTQAHQAVFVELPWKPATIQQARDRLHRIGQEAPVDVTYFVAPHALDICLAAMIGSKADLIADVHVEEVRVFGQAHVAHTPDGDAATEPGPASSSAAKPVRPKSAPVGALPAPTSGEPDGEIETAMALIQQLGTSRALSILRAAVTAASSSSTSQGEDTKRHESSTVARTAGVRRRGRPALPSTERTRRRKAAKAEWWEKHPAYMREYMRKYRQAHCAKVGSHVASVPAGLATRVTND